MQRTVKQETPEYKRNKYLGSPTFEYRRYLELLDSVNK